MSLTLPELVCQQVIPEEKATMLMQNDLLAPAVARRAICKPSEIETEERKLRTAMRRLQSVDLSIQSVAAQRLLTIDNILAGVVRINASKLLVGVGKDPDNDELDDLKFNLIQASVEALLEEFPRLVIDLFKDADSDLDTISRESLPLESRTPKLDIVTLYLQDVTHQYLGEKLRERVQGAQ